MKRLLTTLFAVITFFSCTSIFAAETNCTTGSCVQQPCQQCDIKKHCTPEWEIKKEKKSYYDIEHKDICIPKIRFPWEKSCQPKCGKVMTVKILKKRKYDCEKCKVKWNIFSWTSGCDDNSCAPTAPAGQSTDTVQPPPEPAYVPDLSVPLPHPAPAVPQQ